MKKTTVLVRVRGQGKATAPGWQTDTPGLVCAQITPSEKKSDARWMLFHENSGLHMATRSKRVECNELAVGLAPLMDWTLPEKYMDPMVLAAAQLLILERPSDADGCPTSAHDGAIESNEGA